MEVGLENKTNYRLFIDEGRDDESIEGESRDSLLPLRIRNNFRRKTMLPRLTMGGRFTLEPEGAIDETPDLSTNENPDKGFEIVLNEREKALPKYDYKPSLENKTIKEVFLEMDFDHHKLTKEQLLLTCRHVYGFLSIEIAIVALFGLLYLWMLSSFPYTNINETIMLSSQYLRAPVVCSLYFLTLVTTIIVIGYGFWPLLYGLRRTKVVLLWTLLPGVLTSFIFVVALSGRGALWFYGLDLLWFVFLGVLLFLGSRAMSKVLISPKLIVIYCVPLVFHIIIIALYSFVVIPAYRFNRNQYFRIFIRVIIHPLLTKINLAISMKFCKEYEKLDFPHLATGVVFGVWVENAMFGRLLLSGVGNVFVVSATSALVGLLDIFMRVINLKFERVFAMTLYRLMKKYPLAEKMFGPIDEFILDPATHPKELLFFAQFINTTMVVEKVAIIVVPFMLVWFYPHRLAINFSYTTSPPSPLHLAGVFTIQFIIQSVVDFISVNVEVLQGVPMLPVWRLMRPTYIVWEVANFIQVITLIIYCFRMLPFRLFCPQDDPCTCEDTFISKDLFIAAGICTS